MLILNYVEIIICFSIFYLASDSIATTTYHSQKILNNTFDSLYFSTVTITTLGYGDFVPTNLCGKLLIIFQLIISFIFIVVIINKFMNIEKPKNLYIAEELKKLDELKEKEIISQEEFDKEKKRLIERK